MQCSTIQQSSFLNIKKKKKKVNDHQSKSNVFNEQKKFELNFILSTRQ